jgi:transposase InsO family protein
LRELIKSFGVPKRIISDRGTSFTSNEFKVFTDQFGITHHLNAVGMPRGNGQVERYNRTILNSLATMGAGVSDTAWDENLLNIQLGLNGSVNSAIGVAPSEALMGFRVIHTGALNNAHEVVDVTKIREKIMLKTKEYQLQQKKRFDSKRKAPPIYTQGDLVMIRVTSNPATGTSQKLLPKWRGPFRVTQVLENERYEVSDIPGAVRSRVKYVAEAAAENMKSWIRYDEQ